MLGYTARDIPIANRLWIAFLILFLVVLLVQPSWLVYVQHPLEYPIELLVVLGQILFVEICLDFAFVLLINIAETVGRRIDNRKRLDAFYYLEDHSSSQGCLLPFTSALFFTIAVILAPELGLPSWTAFCGWVGLLESEIFELDRTPGVASYQYVVAEMREHSELVFFCVRVGKKRLVTTMKTGWHGMIAYLTDNGWEIVETHQADIPVDCQEGRTTVWKRTALFRRPEGPWASLANAPGETKEYFFRTATSLEKSYAALVRNLKEFDARATRGLEELGVGWSENLLKFLTGWLGRLKKFFLIPK
jgi:hypothetical protein